LLYSVDKVFYFGSFVRIVPLNKQNNPKSQLARFPSGQRVRIESIALSWVTDRCRFEPAHSRIPTPDVEAAWTNVYATLASAMQSGPGTPAGAVPILAETI